MGLSGGVTESLSSMTAAQQSTPSERQQDNIRRRSGRVPPASDSLRSARRSQTPRARLRSPAGACEPRKTTQIVSFPPLTPLLRLQGSSDAT
eukprot:scaffold7352_cov254-Pinguiococcus_pyrenoidosus.AAC.26